MQGEERLLDTKGDYDVSSTLVVVVVRIKVQQQRRLVNYLGGSLAPFAVARMK